MTRSLKFLMLATDSGLLVYWAMSALVAMRLLNLPSDWLFGHHDDPAVQAWNWSFLPLDVVLSVAGLMSVRLAARNATPWRTLATLSLALTVAAGLMAISFWAVRGEFDLVWWAFNLYLMTWPMPFLATDLGRQLRRPFRSQPRIALGEPAKPPARDSGRPRRASYCKRRRLPE